MAVEESCYGDFTAAELVGNSFEAELFVGFGVEKADRRGGKTALEVLLGVLEHHMRQRGEGSAYVEIRCVGHSGSRESEGWCSNGSSSYFKERPSSCEGEDRSHWVSK